MKRHLLAILTIIIGVNSNIWAQTAHPDAFIKYPFVDYQRPMVLTNGWYYDGTDCVEHYGQGIDYDVGFTPLRNSHSQNTFHVVAAADGEITAKVNEEDSGGYGYLIVISHNINGVRYDTAYAHLDTTPPLPIGTPVKRGQFIAWADETGNAQGVHLHFELRTPDGKKDPYQLYAKSNGWDCENEKWTNCYFLSNDCNESSLGQGMQDNYYWDSNPPSYSNLIVPGFYQAGVTGWRYPNGAPIGYSEMFLNAYNNWINDTKNPNHNSLGIPWDNDHDTTNPNGVYVHEFYGMHIQDLEGQDNGLIHPYSALIKSPDGTNNVYLLKEGFWLQWMYNIGWHQYGYPLSDEESWNNPSDGLTYTRQIFSKKILAWRQESDVLVLDNNDVLVQDANVSFHNNTTTKLAGDGIYHTNRFVTNFDQPIRLIQGESFSGLYAIIGGAEYQINQFTVSGDMTINVGEEEVIPNPCLITNTNIPTGWLASIGINGNYAYIGDNAENISIVNISNPSNPVIENIIPNLPGYPSEIKILDDYAYISCYGSIVILDISNPSNPIIAAEVDYNNGMNQDIDIDGNYAYIAVRWGTNRGLQIIDISNPISPLLINSISTTLHCYQIAAYNNYVYLGESQFLDIFNVSDPLNPIKLNSIDLGSTIRDIKISWPYIYTDSQNNGLTIFNVSDPLNPINIGSAPLEDPSDIVLSNNYIYVGNTVDGNMETNIFDISDPTNPTIIDVISDCKPIKEKNNYLYGYSYSTSSGYIFSILQKSCGIIPEISANFVGDPVIGIADFDVHFYDYSTGYPNSWFWDFGDGSHSIEKNPVHNYNTRGHYSVTLTVSNGLSEDSKTITDMIFAKRPYIAEDTPFPHNEPNPFNPITTISFKLNMTSYVKLEIFDLGGHKICTLIDGIMQQGIHKTSFDGHQLASGVYFYRLSNNGSIYTNKMILLK